MIECNKCEAYGLRFKRDYKPTDFLEGRKDSHVWIVGLNPSGEQHSEDERTIEKLEKHFAPPSVIHPYFRKFKSVSESLFDNLGQKNGTAHTDLVKCTSRTFPPKTARRGEDILIINNCKGFLEEQIKTHKPKLIVCNGINVSNFMLDFLPPPPNYKKTETSYWSSIDDTKICVVLSGFIGRIDNYARRRFGIEIERRIDEINSKKI